MTPKEGNDVTKVWSLDFLDPLSLGVTPPTTLTDLCFNFTAEERGHSWLTVRDWGSLGSMDPRDLVEHLGTPLTNLQHLLDVIMNQNLGEEFQHSVGSALNP